MISVSPSESGRSGSRTRKALSKCSTGFQPVPVSNRVALPIRCLLLFLIASTRTRTRNASLEARNDFRFTIEA